MASYATVDQFRAYVEQVPTGVDVDAKVQDALDRATAIIEGELGFAFGGFGAVAKRRWSSNGGVLLHLPYHQAGTLVATSVKPVHGDLIAGVAYTDWETEWDDPTYLWRQAGWPKGRYEAEAAWGYGDAPSEIVEVTLQVAVNLWQARQAGRFSDVIGVEGGGAVGYARALTNQQRMVIQNVRTKYGDFGFA